MGTSGSATRTSTTQTRYPLRNWVRVPAAKMLENAAGTIIRVALIKVRERALSNPSVEGEGAISFNARRLAAKNDVSSRIWQLVNSETRKSV
jgi:hypothetical protein